MCIDYRCITSEGKSTGLSGAISGGVEQLLVNKATWNRLILQNNNHSSDFIFLIMLAITL